MADKKRKGLMDTIADYQREEKQKRTYAAKKKPALAKKAAKTKSNTKKAFGYNARLDESLGARNGKKTQSMKDRRDESKGAEKAAGRPAYSGNKSSSQGKTTTSKHDNKDGTHGKHMPSNPKVGITMAPRKKRPGTGRTGEAAAKAANRSVKPRHKETMTAAKRRAMRLKARRGR
jgi:hypothetical protein